MAITPQDYLQNLVQNFDYSLTPEDQKSADRDLAQFITSKLFRKKFRKQKLDPKVKDDITEKVKLSIQKQQPLFFAIPFGGYKHYWNPSHPETDWAEIFALRFLIDWVAPVLLTHTPGVIIEFVSEDLILPLMNNYPPEALEKYSQAFTNILKLFSENAPKNLNLSFFRVGDRYNKDKIIAEVEQLLPERWEKWETYSKEQKEIEIKRSVRSVFWNGKNDLTGLSEEEKQKKIIESRLIELAYYDVEVKPEYLGDYYTRDNHIPICFSFGLSPDNLDHWITLGSTYASTVDYWIGRGILQEHKESFIPRIVSKEQYNNLVAKIEKIEIDTSLNQVSKNYRTIDTIKEKDW
jgi:hypothetical protein